MTPLFLTYDVTQDHIDSFKQLAHMWDRSKSNLESCQILSQLICEESPLTYDLTQYLTWLLYFSFMWHRLRHKTWLLSHVTRMYHMTWLFYTWYMTWLLHTWLDSFIHALFICDMTYQYLTWLLYTWHTTWLLHTGHVSFIYDMTHAAKIAPPPKKKQPISCVCHSFLFQSFTGITATTIRPPRIFVFCFLGVWFCFSGYLKIKQPNNKIVIHRQGSHNKSAT